MKAKDVMTPSVITVSVDGTVKDAVRAMLDNHISGLPVIDAEGRLVGLVSEGDLMRRVKGKNEPRRSWWLELLAGPGDPERDFVEMHSRHVSDIMTRDVETVAENTPVPEIAGILERKRFKRVPVVRDGKVVGIVSRSNLLQALAFTDTSALHAPGPSEEDLRRRVQKALSEVPGVQANLINFIVKDGTVEIWGVADNDEAERAVQVATENVDGVREVKVNMGRLPAWGYGI